MSQLNLLTIMFCITPTHVLVAVPSLSFNLSNWSYPTDVFSFFFWDDYYINKEKAPEVQVHRWKNSKKTKNTWVLNIRTSQERNYKMRLCQSKALSSGTEGIGHGNDPEFIEREGWRWAILLMFPNHLEQHYQSTFWLSLMHLFLVLSFTVTLHSS